MGIIQTLNLAYEYLIRNDEGKIIDHHQILKDINIDIKKGDFIAILGHNGSGKSTLARQLNALLKPTNGTVWIDQLDSKDDKNTYEIRKKAGMVFQNPDNQIVASVVEEDIAFGPENIGIPSDDIWLRVDIALHKTGITEFRYDSPNKLSGGQKQRVAIAGVLAMKPSCIILDESTAMLDPKGRKEVLAVIHELNKNENITIILITHYMEEAVDADYIYVMNHGQIVMQDIPDKIFSRIDELKSYHLAVPEVTELAWELKKEGIPISFPILHENDLIQQLQDIFK